MQSFNYYYKKNCVRSKSIEKYPALETHAFDAILFRYIEIIHFRCHVTKVSANENTNMAGEEAFLSGEALDLFWEYFDEDVLEENVQDQLVADLEEVKNKKY